VQTDYFAQDQYKALDPNARLIDDIATVAPTAMSGQTKLRTLLGCFLFSDDEVFKTIGVLSGGERNRYALARMLLNPPNFLLLDEPTNHLDLRAKDVLLEALQKFNGTIVFVSHDRYFIDKLANRIFEIEGGELRDYAGNYEDYLWQKERGATNSASSAGDSNFVSVSTAPKSEAPQTRAKKLNPIVLRKLEDRRNKLEEEIARCEAEIAACEMETADFKSAEESIRLATLMEQGRARLGELLKEWEQIAVSLEEPGKEVMSER